MKLKIQFTISDSKTRDIMQAAGLNNPVELIQFIRNEFVDVTGLDPDSDSDIDLQVSTVTDA